MKLEVFEDRMYYDQWCVRPEGSKSFYDTIHFDTEKDALVAQHVIEKWIAQEREACAKVCDEHWRFNSAASECAAAIRARGER